MNKTFLFLVILLLAISSSSQLVFASTSDVSQGRMMSPEAFCSLDAKLLFRGTRGTAVTKYQKVLAYYFDKNPQESLVALPELSIDGNFGRTTRMYTIFFQNSNGLGGDGFVGKKTRAALTTWCFDNYGTSGNEDLEVRLGSEVVLAPNSSFTIAGTAVSIHVSRIYGNKCSANATANTMCTMEYSPTIRISGTFGGDVGVPFSSSLLGVGESATFSTSGDSANMDATIKLVSVSDDGTSVRLLLDN